MIASLAGVEVEEDNPINRGQALFEADVERFIRWLLGIKSSDASSSDSDPPAPPNGETTPANPDPNKPSVTNGEGSKAPRGPEGTVKLLSKGEIKMLQKNGYDVHELKAGMGKPKEFDLYKDQKGNIFVIRKGGKGEPDPTGININDLR